MADHAPSNIPADQGGASFGEEVSIGLAVKDPEEKTIEGAEPSGFAGANKSRID